MLDMTLKATLLDKEKSEDLSTQAALQLFAARNGLKLSNTKCPKIPSTGRNCLNQDKTINLEVGSTDHQALEKIGAKIDFQLMDLHIPKDKEKGSKDIRVLKIEKDTSGHYSFEITFGSKSYNSLANNQHLKRIVLLTEVEEEKLSERETDVYS
jgi:hypothetical protein